jgi:hypothetical protein
MRSTFLVFTRVKTEYPWGRHFKRSIPPASYRGRGSDETPGEGEGEGAGAPPTPRKSGRSES